VPGVVRLRLLLVATALAACSLGGCTGQGAQELPDGGEGAALPDGEGPAGRSLLKPAWAVGDAWVYELGGVATTYVITSETATDWIMETDSPERSFADARQDISRLGPQRKSDLAGSQGGDRVEFFRWPLEAGKAWSTRWDHLDVDVRVVDLVDGVATLEATLASDGSLAYRYTYSAGDRWFGDLRHFAPDGKELVHLVLKEARHGWSGTVVRWELIELNASKGSNGATVLGPLDFPLQMTDLWGEYHFTCTGAGGYTVGFEAVTGLAFQPTPQEYRDSGPCVQVDVAKVLVEAPISGKWLFTLGVGGQTADFDYAFLLRKRTDVTFPA
jgi:hypothetical protein